MELCTSDAETVTEIGWLIATYTDGAIADVLNEHGVRTIVATPWTATHVRGPRANYPLSDLRTCLLVLGLLTPEDVATSYGVALSIPPPSALTIRRGVNSLILDSPGNPAVVSLAELIASFCA